MNDSKRILSFIKIKNIKNYVSKFLCTNRPSLALVILTWLAFNFNSIFSIYPIKIIEFLMLIISILGLEGIFIFISNKKISSFFLINAFIFFFGYLITQYVFNILQNDLNIYIRGRFIFIFILVMLNTININLNKTNNFKYMNLFLIIFISINFISDHLRHFPFQKNKLITLKYINNNFPIRTNQNGKSILLVIFDEYQSPFELYNVTKDSSKFNFSRKLSFNGWETNDNFHSNETHTEKSLSSLFNYNLSKDKKFAKTEVSETLFKNNLLFNDLRLKSVNIVNRGIFPFGNTNAIGLNYFPESSSLISLILNNTTFWWISNRTRNFNLDGFDVNFYPQSDYNIKNNFFLKDSIYNKIEKTTFFYVHFYMPHNPFVYGSQFKYKKNNLENYISYWNFTNDLMINTLLNLSKSNKFKIIVSGDHGYRSDSRLDKSKTFLALYGFSTQDINSVKSVQDLGNLINSNF
jgi:hypothetical protein